MCKKFLPPLGFEPLNYFSCKNNKNPCVRRLRNFFPNFPRRAYPPGLPLDSQKFEFEFRVEFKMPYRVELSSSSLKKHRVFRVYRVRVCRVMVKFFDYNKHKNFNKPNKGH